MSTECPLASISLMIGRKNWTCGELAMSIHTRIGFLDRADAGRSAEGTVSARAGGMMSTWQ